MIIKKKILLVYLFSYIAAPLAYSVRVLYSRTLSLEDMGLIWSILGLLGLFCIFNDLGFTETLNYYATRFFEKKEYGKLKATVYFAFFTQLFSSVLVSIILFFVAPFLATHYFQSPGSVDVFRFFLIYMIGINITASFVNLFVALHEYYYFQFTESIRIFFTLLISLIAILFMHKDLGLIALSWGIGALIVFILVFLSVKLKYVNIFAVKAEFSWKLYSQLFKYAFQIILGSAAMLLLGRIDVAILTGLSTLSNVAIYSNVLSIAQILLVLLGPISTIFFPLTSKLSVTNEQKEIKNLCHKFFTVGIFATLPILLMTITYPQEIIIFLFGVPYVSGKLALIVLAISSYIYFLTTLPIGIVSGLGKIKVRTKAFYYAAISNIILCFILIPYLGIMGAALATLISTLIIFIPLLIFTLKELDYNIFKLNKGYYAKLVIANLLFLAIITILKKILALNVIFEGIIVFILGGLAYFIFALAIKLISIQEIKNIMSLNK